MLTNHIIWKVNPCNTLVQDDLKLPDDGGKMTKSQGRGWQFESRLRNLLSTGWKACHVINCLMCFGRWHVGLLSQENNNKESM